MPLINKVDLPPTRSVPSPTPSSAQGDKISLYVIKCVFESPISDKSCQVREQQRAQRILKSSAARKLSFPKQSNHSSKSQTLLDSNKSCQTQGKQRAFQSSLVRRLFPSEEDSGSSKSQASLDSTNTQTSEINLNTIYEMDLEVVCQECSELKQQVLLLEKKLKEVCKFVEDMTTARQHIKKILHSQESHLNKMSELGIMYYFLDREKEFVTFQKDSYFQDRLEEITEEIIHLEKSFKSAITPGDKSAIDSGKTLYVLRTYAHMVFGQSGELNIGGIDAISLFLERYHAVFLSDDHIRQIKTILSQLKTNSQLIAEFAKFLPVLHSDAFKILHIDLKLPPSSQIHPTSIKIACLLALFTDRKQFENEGNCFAIAPLKTALHHCPHLLVSFWYTVLSQGHFYLKNGDPLHSYTFLERRLLPHEVLDAKINNSKDLQKLPVLETIARVLRLDLTLSSTKENLSFLDNLRQILSDNKRPKNMHGAYIVLSTFHLNVLQEAFVTYLQLISTNSTPSSKDLYAYKQTRSTRQAKAPENPLPNKQYLMHWFATKFKEKVFSVFPMLEWQPGALDFLDVFESNMRAAFTVEDLPLSFPSITDEGLKIYGQPNVVTPYKIDSQDLKNLIFCSRCLVFKKGDTYRRIYNHTRLKEAFENLLDVTYQSFVPPNKNIENMTAEMRKYVGSKDFNSDLARLNVSLNTKIPVKEEVYQESELLLFYQNGGNPSTCLSKALNLKFELYSVPSTDERDFIVQLVLAIREYFPDIENSTLPILAYSAKHGFTITPCLFSDYLSSSNEEEINRIIDEELIIPALHFRLTKEQGRHIVEPFLSNEQVEKICDTQTFPMTTQSFLQLVVPSISHDSLPLFYEKLHQKMMTFTYDHLPFKEICDEIGILNEDLISEMDQEFKNRCVQKKCTKIVPRQAASLMRKILIQRGMGIFDIHFLERLICIHLELPRTLILGDTNYFENNKTNFRHIHLAVRYDFETEKLQFYHKGKYEKKLNAYFSEQLYTFHLHKII